MYVYSFTKYAGFDRVFRLEVGGILGGNQMNDINPGDLIRIGDNIFLVLGTAISFTEQYTYPYRTAIQPEIVYSKFVTEKTLQMMHWMVYERYSTYKAVVKYFVSHDVMTLLEREETGSKSRAKIKEEIFVERTPFNPPYEGGQISEKGQTLIVFPDLWTLTNSVHESILSHKLVSFLFSTQTQNQQDRHWRKIKHGLTRVVLGTHAEIFQDFNNLQKILFVDPHKRYYSNQQDPRYKTGMVIEKMKEIYGCEVFKL